MSISPYDLIIGDQITTFEFVSEGPKGKVQKLIQFSVIEQLQTTTIYNLASGDKNTSTGELDDLIVTGNNDTEKVLATVVAAVYLFFNMHSESTALIYATGSTKARTRLYKMGISRYFDEQNSDLWILGQTETHDWLPFQKNTDYKAFLVGKEL